MYKILDLLIEVFNNGGDSKLDVAVSANRTAELTRISLYVAQFSSLSTAVIMLQLPLHCCIIMKWVY